MPDPGYFTKLRLFLSGQRAGRPRSAKRPSRRPVRHASSFALESLEPRVLFAADLAGAVQTMQMVDPLVPQQAAISVLETDQGSGANNLETSAFVDRLVNTVSSGQQLKPAVAMDQAGDFVVVWEDDQDRNGRFEILARGFNPDGTQRFSTVTVNTVSNGQQLKPAVAIDQAGNFVVAWEDNLDGNEFFDVRFRGFNADGTPNPRFPDELVHTADKGDQLKPAVAMNAAGNFVVAWEDDSTQGDGINVLVSGFKADGTEIFSDKLVHTAINGDQLKPAVAMNVAGSFVVAWEDDSTRGDGINVLARGFNADGSRRFSDRPPVHTAINGDQLKPAVAMDQAGNFVVAWEDDSTRGDGINILARGFNADGTPNPRFSDKPVHTEDDGDQLKPAVAMDQAGHFVVVWEDDQDRNGRFEILARGFNPDGTQCFSDVTVNTVSDGQQLKPAVAMDAVGNFVVAWEDSQKMERDSSGNLIPVFDIMARGEPADLLRRNADGTLPNAVSTDDLLDDLGLPPGGLARKVVELTSNHLGWQWIDRHNPYRSVTGEVVRSRVTHEDFPNTHLSHDQTFHVLVDDGLEGLVSVANSGPLDFIDPRGQRRDIEVEWETGIKPTEKRGDGTAGRNGQAIFPDWVWPSTGDRVWVNGNWIYDLGHQEGGKFRSEIHPPRAIAVMRDQIMPLKASGDVPIKVTATDLYIHGDSGLAKKVIELTDQQVGDPLRQRTVLDPIAEDFEFDIPLPPRPANAPFVVPVVEIEPGPGNTIDIPLRVELDALGENLQVTVPLSGSGVTPLDVYARRIRVGWPTPVEDLRQIRLTLDSMLVRNDMDETFDFLPGEFSGELSFFWLNVGTVPGREWIRLSDHTAQNMNDLESGSTVRFTGTTFDYFTENPSSSHIIPIFADGYDQDTIEKYFGTRFLGSDAIDNNDRYGSFPAGPSVPVPLSTQPSTFTLTNSGDEYRLTFRVQEMPLTDAEKQHPPVALKIVGDPSPLSGADDVITLMRTSTNPSLLNVSMTSTLIDTGQVLQRSQSIPLSAVQGIEVNGLSGNDKLIVDSSNGLISLPTGMFGFPGTIRFDGGTGTDAIHFEQAGGDTQTANSYSLGSTDRGDQSVITGPSGRQIVEFNNLESVLDLVPSSSLAISGPPRANTFTVTQGSVPANDKVIVDGEPPIEFANKVQLAIAGTGFEGDTFNLTPSANVLILVDGGSIIDGPSEGTGVDTLNVNGERLNYGLTGVRFTEETDERKAVDYTRIESLGLSSGMFATSGDVFPDVALNDAATLKGNGTLRGTLAANAGGTVAPGLTSGVLATGSATFSPGSTFSVELNGTAAGIGHDQLAVTGTVDLGSANLVATLGYTPAATDRLVILANDDTDPVIGMFNGLPEGASLDVARRLFRISYKGGDGNDVALTAGIRVIE